MNPLLSYARHCIVIAVFYIVEKYDLPMEGASEAIEWIALAVVTSATCRVVVCRGVVCLVLSSSRLSLLSHRDKSRARIRLGLQ